MSSCSERFELPPGIAESYGLRQRPAGVNDTKIVQVEPKWQRPEPVDSLAMFFGVEPKGVDERCMLSDTLTGP